MQNNVTELTQKLLKSLDSNYNVIDMPTVIEVISLLEKVAITKELLQTTRLGKHVNELRRHTTDDGLSRRTKVLVKKWRDMVLPDYNGQIKTSPQEDVNLNQLKTAKKRTVKEPLEGYGAKRARVNGVSELDFSDNSNSSFSTDLLSQAAKQQDGRVSNVIIVNSDSNSSMPEKMDPHLDQQMPKKRGRKKGSKNHKNLLDEAESSFTNKLAVSRGNSKVKTTQELIASLQNKTCANATLGNASAVKGKEDLNERAAKLTERVSIIDQKLNTNASRYKNNQRSRTRPDRVIESGSVINDRSLLNTSSADEDQIIVVDDVAPDPKRDSDDDDVETRDDPDRESRQQTDEGRARSLAIDECLALMPPVDRSWLEAGDAEPVCTCLLKEGTDRAFEFIEDHECVARARLTDRYRLGAVDEERVRELHSRPLPGVNGNYALGAAKVKAEPDASGLYERVVPDVMCELLERDEGALRTELSEGEGGGVFREWFELAETPSYGDEPLRILPYVIID